MSFSDHEEEFTRRLFPEEWQARNAKVNGEYEVVTGPIKPLEPTATDAELLIQFGYNPEEIEIVGTVNQWKKQLPNGEWRTSYFFKHRPKSASLDLPSLYQAASKKKQPKIKGERLPKTVVIALSDLQIGKTGSRGGTPELLARLLETRARLEHYLKTAKPESLVLAEVGDLFEGFESGGNPMWTNDLSLAQQMDVAATEVYEFVKLMARFGHVDVVAVPSNHTAWRNGKQNLGNPQDDLGLFVHQQVKKVAEAAGLDATWTFPAPYDEGAILDVRGTVIGVIHGNQYSPGGAPSFWGKMQHGGQPIGSADVLVTGHYHHLTIIPSGRNPYTKRSKYWLQAPTLDNGSDWFRNRAGQDSDPGLLVFAIDDKGFNLQSLAVL
jgi:hypothetical protein